MEEKVVHFRMEGHLRGEPSIFTVKNIKNKNSGHGGQGVSVVAKLGE
jgi:hypothetical protein